MDIIRTLNSILSPGISPVNRARPAVPVTETQSGQRSFAQTLEDAAGNDPSIAPFGVTGRRPASSLPSAPGALPRPQIEALAPLAGGAQGIFNGTGGPTVLPDNPGADQPATDLPIDELHVEIGEVGDTLGSVLIKQTEVLSEPEPLLPPPADDATPANGGNPPTTTDGKPPVVSSKPPAVEPPSAAPLPAMPIPWPAKALLPSGATGVGISSTVESVNLTLATKHAQYQNPAAAGVSDIGPEGRLFRDAVSRGYVPDTPEGLGTMLAYLSLSSAPADGRPAAISQYFNSWFSQGVANV